MARFLDNDDPISQSFRIANHIFPGAWRYMMPAELSALSLPAERQSTCMSCPKTCTEQYRPDYRCCTYHPRIPNFLLGLALVSDKKGVLAPILEGSAMITPEGLHESPAQWYAYLADTKDEKFGKSQNVLCPLLDTENGLCRVHAFRNSVCSTFFCLKDHGAKSENFWEQLLALGSQVETLLSQWALKQIGFDFDAYTERLNAHANQIETLSLIGSKGWKKTSLEMLWGDWYGKELELYKQTARLISEHRHSLWDIANNTEITDAGLYERALVAAVPQDLKDEIDEQDQDDNDDNLETIAYKPAELWQKLYRAHQSLNAIQYGVYRLNRRLRLEPNTRKDSEESYHESKPYFIGMSSGKNDWEWRLFLSCQEKQLLELFQNSLLIDFQFIHKLSRSGHEKARTFILELINRRILIKQKKPFKDL